MFKFIDKIFKSKKVEQKSIKKSEMYPYCEIAYKLDNSLGWNLAIMNGDKNEVNKKCQSQNWFKYEIFDGGKCTWQIADKLKYYMRPSDVHLLSDWVYWQELDKWFIYEDEIIPYPQKTGEETNDISFVYSLNDPDNYWNNPDDFDNVEEVYVHAEVNIKTSTQNANSVIEFPLVCDEFEKFINNLKNNKFAVLHIIELSSDKYMAWEKDNKIRFMVHDYSDNEKEYIPIIMDVLVDKDIFYNKFEDFYSKLKCDSNNLMQKVVEIVKNR